MMDVTLDVKDDLTPMLRQLGMEAPKLLDVALGGTAQGYRNHARKSLGTMLKKRTGATYRQLAYFKSRARVHTFVVTAPSLANIYEHKGGATIRPARRKARKGGKRRPALKFVVGGRTVFTKRVHLAQRPFMSTSYATFDFGATFEAKTNAAIERVKKRLGLN